jgi:hypothetical protein
MQSLLITTVISPALRWHLLRLCMEESAEHRCFGTRLEKSQLFGPDNIREAERQVEIIRENLKVAQSRQKSYADPRRREVVLEVGDYAYLIVSPIHGLRRFNVKGKLSPRFIGPFKIVERRGEVAY